ncbi:dihydrolipoyl dehydrogenase [Mycolicibacterium litorale]|nr:dihydrolipoyl dehydrogenase [Mycolicibacterium litorale]
MTDHINDLVILGGGSAGYACALRAAQLGLSVVLIEKSKLGGTCLHHGCIPTKALLHVAEVADAVREGADIGVLSQLSGIDLEAANMFKDSIVGRLHRGLQGLVRSRDIEYIAGTGRFVGPQSVEVDGLRYTGRHIVLATGSHPRTVSGIPLSKRVITSDQALSLTEMPPRAVVLGGGVIGAEFASMWRSFGSEVTIVEARSRLLPNDDQFTSQLLERGFRRRGIHIETAVSVDSVTETADSVTVSLSSGEQIATDLLLVAIGRGPNTTGLGYPEAGLALDRGFIRTDARLRTNLTGVYAVGDVVAGVQLAHRGFQHGIFVAEDIADVNPRPVDEDGIPRVTYSHPEVASVGLSEDEAKERYGEVSTVIYDLGGNGKSQILQTAGAVKLIKAGAAGAPGRILGIHMVGARVGELIGEAQLVYNWHAEATDVAALIHAHPSQSEALGEAHLALAGKALHAHS